MTKAAKKDPSDTPVMRQFRTAKEQHPDALVFFRMGDFYELFYEDAQIASRALDLTLTSRNKASEDAIPMAGVPHHAASSYIQRLIDQGHRVAICEQMADPSTVRGIVPRAVVRVVSPGVAFDDSGVPSRQNLFLSAIFGAAAKGPFGVASFDASTGELLACEAEDSDVALAEIMRLEPREILFDEYSAELVSQVSALRKIHTRPAERSENDLASWVGQAASTWSLPMQRAAVTVLSAAQACEPLQPISITETNAYDPKHRLFLDETTQRHLELLRSVDGDPRGSLLAHIDETVSSFGARLFRRSLVSPLSSVAEIRARHDQVELFVKNPGLRKVVRASLSRLADFERIAMKLRTGRATPKDLGALAASLAELPALSLATGEMKEAVASGPPFSDLDLCEDAARSLQDALASDLPAKLGDGPVFRTGFDAELDEYRGLLSHGQEKVVDLEQRLREISQIPTVKIRYTRVFGWYIEVSRSHIGKAPSSWRRKQTIATGERYSSEELDALAEKLASAESSAATRETSLWKALCEKLTADAQRFSRLSHNLAVWDVVSSLAETAHRFDYARPIVDDSKEFVIEDGRHPVVERTASLGKFVPNDCALDASGANHARMWLITGPNMAGKSTFMRQNALIVILAQMGSFVPAKSARIGLVDRVLTRVGASDNLAKGESTFMVEMKETAQVLKRATSRSFVVLDEIGRGTSTFDGLSIAWAVAEYLHDVSLCRALFATHYHELTELSNSRAAIENFSVSAREHDGHLVFLHAVQKGSVSRSFGVACAKLAGVPEPVLVRARQVLSLLEKGKKAEAESPQLGLFAGAAIDPVVESLREMDLERMTPLEAMMILVDLKKRATPVS